MQAQLTSVLGLHRTSSKVSVISIASFVKDADTRRAYRQFCKNLHQIGVTEDMIRQKENEILEVLRSQSTAASSQIGSSNITNQFEAGCSHTRNFSFLYIQPLTYRQIVILAMQKLNLRGNGFDQYLAKIDHR